MGAGIDFVRTKHAAYQEIIQEAAAAQEKANYSAQALELMGKTAPTQDDMDQIVTLVQKLV